MNHRLFNIHKGSGVISYHLLVIGIGFTIDMFEDYVSHIFHYDKDNLDNSIWSMKPYDLALDSMSVWCYLPENIELGIIGNEGYVFNKALLEEEFLFFLSETESMPDLDFWQSEKKHNKGIVLVFRDMNQYVHRQLSKYGSDSINDYVLAISGNDSEYVFDSYVEMSALPELDAQYATTDILVKASTRQMAKGIGRLMGLASEIEGPISLTYIDERSFFSDPLPPNVVTVQLDVSSLPDDSFMGEWKWRVLLNKKKLDVSSSSRLFKVLDRIDANMMSADDNKLYIFKVTENSGLNDGLTLNALSHIQDVCANNKINLFEGNDGYGKGLYRSTYNCLMRHPAINTSNGIYIADYCPVCERYIKGVLLGFVDYKFGALNPVPFSYEIPKSSEFSLAFANYVQRSIRDDEFPLFISMSWESTLYWINDFFISESNTNSKRFGFCAGMCITGEDSNECLQNEFNNNQFWRFPYYCSTSIPNISIILSLLLHSYNKSLQFKERYNAAEKNEVGYTSVQSHVLEAGQISEKINWLLATGLPGAIEYAKLGKIINTRNLEFNSFNNLDNNQISTLVPGSIVELWKDIDTFENFANGEIEVDNTSDGDMFLRGVYSGKDIEGDSIIITKPGSTNKLKEIYGEGKQFKYILAAQWFEYQKNRVHPDNIYPTPFIGNDKFMEIVYSLLDEFIPLGTGFKVSGSIGATFGIPKLDFGGSFHVTRKDRTSIKIYRKAFLQGGAGVGAGVGVFLGGNYKKGTKEDAGTLLGVNMSAFGEIGASLFLVVEDELEFRVDEFLEQFLDSTGDAFINKVTEDNESFFYSIISSTFHPDLFGYRKKLKFELVGQSNISTKLGVEVTNLSEKFKEDRGKLFTSDRLERNQAQTEYDPNSEIRTDLQNNFNKYFSLVSIANEFLRIVETRGYVVGKLSVGIEFCPSFINYELVGLNFFVYSSGDLSFLLSSGVPIPNLQGDYGIGAGIIFKLSRSQCSETFLREGDVLDNFTSIYHETVLINTSGFNEALDAPLRTLKIKLGSSSFPNDLSTLGKIYNTFYIKQLEFDISIPIGMEFGRKFFSILKHSDDRILSVSQNPEYLVKGFSVIGVVNFKFKLTRRMFLHVLMVMKNIYYRLIELGEDVDVSSDYEEVINKIFTLLPLSDSDDLSDELIDNFTSLINLTVSMITNGNSSIVTDDDQILREIKSIFEYIFEEALDDILLKVDFMVGIAAGAKFGLAIKGRLSGQLAFNYRYEFSVLDKIRDAIKLCGDELLSIDELMTVLQQNDDLSSDDIKSVLFMSPNEIPQTNEGVSCVQ